MRFETERITKVKKEGKVISAPKHVEEASIKLVNCNKCGAALKVKSEVNAYMCPVCKNIFRIQMNAKMVDNQN